MRVNGLRSDNVPGTDYHLMVDHAQAQGERQKQTDDVNALLFLAPKQRDTYERSVENKETKKESVDENRDRWLSRLIKEGRRLFTALWNGGVTEATGTLCAQEKTGILHNAFDERGKAILAHWQRLKIKVYTLIRYFTGRDGGNGFLQTKARGENGRKKETRHFENGKRDSESEKRCLTENRRYPVDSYDKFGKYVRIGQQDPETETNRINIIK